MSGKRTLTDTGHAYLRPNLEQLGNLRCRRNRERIGQVGLDEGRMTDALAPVD